MTADELAELAASFAWTASYVDWGARPTVITFLQSLDALIITEQRRGADTNATLDEALDGVAGACAGLAQTDVQVLLHAWTRIARNRERDQTQQRTSTTLPHCRQRSAACRVGRAAGRMNTSLRYRFASRHDAHPQLVGEGLANPPAFAHRPT